MSKIIFSVLCVLLSFVLLFTFVRASFGVDRLGAKQLVEEVANLSTDFSRTKQNLQYLKDAFNKIEPPKWGKLDFNTVTQDDLRRANGNSATFLLSDCEVKNGGILVVPNGAEYTSREYRISGGYVFITLGFFDRYTVFDDLFATLKDLINKDDSLLSGILKSVLYINSFFKYFDSILSMFLELLLVIIALVKDTVFFVVDVVLFLLKMIGIDTAGKLPSIT